MAEAHGPVPNVAVWLSSPSHWAEAASVLSTVMSQHPRVAWEAGHLWLFSSLSLLGRPELRKTPRDVQSFCSVAFLAGCTLLAVVQWECEGWEAADFCPSRKMQTQFRDGCILYYTMWVRHCLGTIGLIPNLKVLPQPIKYLRCFSKCTLFTLQSIKYLHGNIFLKMLYSEYYFYTHYILDRVLIGLGSGSGFWLQGCLTLGKSIHFSDFLV